MSTNNRSCSVPSCGRNAICRGLCNAHYMRWRRHGDPLAGRVEEGKPAAFLRSVIAAPPTNECIIWPYSKSEGRGQIFWEGNLQLAHRVVCELAHGEPPFDEAHAAHSCGKGHLGCINPEHLRWATCEQNAADRLIHGTDNQGSKNHRAKLNEKDVGEIKKLIAAGKSLASIARDFAVCPATVGHIKSGSSWGHLQ